MESPKTTTIELFMLDQTVKKCVKILCDVLVNVASFIFLIDFAILDYGLDFEVPNILGRLSIVTRCVLVDMESEQMSFSLNNKYVTFNICQSIKYPIDAYVISVINVADKKALVALIIKIVRVTFNIFQSMKYPIDAYVIFVIDIADKKALVALIIKSLRF